MTSIVGLSADLAISKNVNYRLYRLQLQYRNPFIRGDLVVTITSRLMGQTRNKTFVRLWDTDDLSYIREQTKDYLVPGHFDAYCIFEYKTSQALRKYGVASNEVKHMQFMSDFHRKRLSKDQFDAEMASLRLVTIIDIRNHGESLSKPFLHE